MKLQEKIKQDLLSATMEKNSAKKNLLRVVLGEIGRLSSKEVEDADVLKIIRKMKENAIECGNMDEVPILEDYLPKMMSEEEISVFVKEIIESNNFSGVKDMGKVMNAIRLSDKSQFVDNKIASNIVRSQLV